MSNILKAGAAALVLAGGLLLTPGVETDQPRLVQTAATNENPLTQCQTDCQSGYEARLVFCAQQFPGSSLRQGYTACVSFAHYEREQCYAACGE